MNWEYIQPVTIRFGEGVLAELKSIAEQAGYRRGLLVSDPFFTKSGLAGRIVQSCGGLIRAVYDQVSPNPETAEVDACAQKIRDEQIDFLVALGGGSALDCAKAAGSVCFTNDSIRAYHGTGKPLPPEHLPLLAIPTTAGTGSEVTCVSVLSDHALGKKGPIVSENFYPRLALIDPELTYTLPPHMTASTGIDVLCHAVEGYWSKGHQPICDALAIYACKSVFDYLPLAFRQPDHVLARRKMAEASVIAGLAFTLPKTTSSHACSFPLTNLLHIPHGEACALTLDHFMRINADADGGRVQALARELGCADANALAGRIHALKKELGLLTDLKAYALSDAQLAALVQASRHPNLYNNPVNITDEMLDRMYRSMC